MERRFIPYFQSFWLTLAAIMTYSSGVVGSTTAVAILTNEQKWLVSTDEVMIKLWKSLEMERWPSGRVLLVYPNNDIPRCGSQFSFLKQTKQCMYVFVWFIQAKLNIKNVSCWENMKIKSAWWSDSFVSWLYSVHHRLPCHLRFDGCINQGVDH